MPLLLPLVVEWNELSRMFRVIDRLERAETGFIVCLAVTPERFLLATDEFSALTRRYGGNSSYLEHSSLSTVLKLVDAVEGFRMECQFQIGRS